MSLWRRLFRFNVVGAAGIAVQLGLLALFVDVVGLNVAAATAMAVEGAVLHNFFWHRCWTWSERSQGHAAGALLRFHLSNGLVSLAGNVGLTALLAGRWHVPYLAANLLSIVLCSAANFAAGESWVFRRGDSAGA